MYQLLQSPLAQIDKEHFTEIARFRDGVFVAPMTDEVLAGKAIPTVGSSISECQNTFFFCWNVAEDDTDFHDSLTAQAMYEDKNGKTFVEARYEYPIGRLSFVAFFFLQSEDCEFATKNYDDFYEMSIDELCTDDLLYFIDGHVR